MKNRTPLALARDLGRVPETELSKIAEEVTKSLAAARARVVASGAETSAAPHGNTGGK